jgi:predicted NAD/FAD-dependent oxidoreductase
MKSIAVIGAGIAGLVCARNLRRAGHAVQVFDKGRAPGGRTSTRHHRADTFNHGAPWFEVSDPAFREELGAAIGAGALRQLRPELVELRGGRPVKRLDSRWIFAGWPTMNRYAHHLAADLPVHQGLAVTGVRRRTWADGSVGWEVRRGGLVAPDRFDAVVLAMPAPQVEALLPLDHARRGALAEVEMAPVLTAMLAPVQTLDLGWDAAAIESGPLARAVRLRTPGPVPSLADLPAPESWVLHASEAWSRSRLEEDPTRLALDLAEAFEALLGRPLPEVHHISGHRWRYGLTVRALGEACLHDPQQGLGVCGDWCLGDRLEDAWASGRALADRMLAELGEARPQTVQVVWGMVH